MASGHTPEMSRGHRKRMRERILRNGEDYADDCALLETILFELIPRVDTYPAAHLLIEKFGSIEGVFSASEDELEKVDGIGEKTAKRIISLGAMTEMIITKRLSELPLDRKERTYPFLRWVFRNEEYDTVCIIRLDGKSKVLGYGMYRSSSDGTLDLNDEMEKASSCDKTERLILAHNHPKGEPDPSPEDIRSTEIFKALCSGFGITAAAHYIVCDDRIVTLFENSSGTVTEDEI